MRQPYAMYASSFDLKPFAVTTFTTYGGSKFQVVSLLYCNSDRFPWQFGVNVIFLHSPLYSHPQVHFL